MNIEDRGKERQVPGGDVVNLGQFCLPGQKEKAGLKVCMKD